MFQRQAIFIFGMGRSGTSALARVLSLCGAALPERLLGANEGNPTGHWEPLEALKLNEEFLFSNGSTYHDPSLRLQEELVVDEAYKDAFIEKIAAFFDSCSQDRPVVLKEPRIVALSDFWFEAAHRSGFDVKIVIPVRHPAEVAGSLAKRDQASFELSNALWLKYNLLAERRSRIWPRVFVEYSNLLADWQKEVSRISEALSVRFDDRQEDAIREFLTDDLHRQRRGGVLTEAFGPPWVGKVYAEFSAAARGSDVDTGQLDEIFDAYSTSERAFRIASNEFYNRFSGYHWASDLKPFLARVVDECGSEIARRFGDAIPPDGSPADPIRAPFYYQADRVSVALNSLAALAAQLERAHSHAETLGNQLITSLEVAKAHTAREEWLERKVRGLEDELEVQRRSAQDREEALTHEVAWSEARLGDANARARDLNGALESTQDRLSAAEAQIAQLGDANARARDLKGALESTQDRLSAAEAQIARLVAKELASQETIAHFHSLIGSLKAQLETYERSRSWRLTAPLRAVRRLGRGAPPVSPPVWELSGASREGANDDASAGHRDSGLIGQPAPATAGADSNALPEGFDRNAYLMLHPDVAASADDPARHYLRHGRQEGRAYLRSDLELKEHATAALAIVTGDVGSNELPEGFNGATYLALHPDVAASGVDPVSHYMSFGRLEGRAYSFPGIDLKGAHNFQPDRDSILVVSHDASRTGAPVVSLNLVLNLVGRYNVIVLLLGDGPLVDSFVQAGAVTSVSHLRRYPILTDSVVGRLHDRFNFKFALVNSIESRVVLKALAARFVPVVSLIHEFAAYTRPRDAFTEALLWSTEVVFSADVTRQSALREAPDSDVRSVHTLPQGRCLVPAAGADEELEKESERLIRWIRPEGSRDGLVVVLGAGSVHLRKGVDLFIEVAARVVSAPGGDNCRFVWFGNGYDPDGDVHYSAYLVDQIRRAGLEEYVFFAGETPAIETVYREADIFLMSSRLDPMPNVAVDALAHGKPVLCFDRATGIADFLKATGLGDRCVARYLDTAEMADKIRVLVNSERLRHEVGERGREASASFFSMKNYVSSLEALARGAADRARREEQDVKLILGSGLFRPDFSVPPDMAPIKLESAVRLYVRAWASGIRRRKPSPGFHPGVYLEQHGVAIEGSDPTADYIRTGRPDGPWNCTVIGDDGKEMRDLPANHSVALHLHVYYPDLLTDIMTRLSCNRIRPDLLVSVTSEEARNFVAAHLKDYEGNVAAIELVPNRGRDIGPFLTTFGRQILADYEYVGHIHTKKTEVVKDAGMGKVWFEFLLVNLLGGGSGNMADTILASMKVEPSIGMVFPDDPHAQGWNANREFAELLAARIGLGDLPQHFNFPVGTMFWVRTPVLAPLIDLNLRWDDYPLEPLPYDGTMLHAIERLLPLTLRAGTLRVATTNVAGVTR